MGNTRTDGSCALLFVFPCLENEEKADPKNDTEKKKKTVR